LDDYVDDDVILPNRLLHAGREAWSMQMNTPAIYTEVLAPTPAWQCLMPVPSVAELGINNGSAIDKILNYSNDILGS
jgi:hypothetical protein